jgi:hypothetical protein
MQILCKSPKSLASTFTGFRWQEQRFTITKQHEIWFLPFPSPWLKPYANLHNLKSIKYTFGTMEKFSRHLIKITVNSLRHSLTTLTNSELTETTSGIVFDVVPRMTGLLKLTPVFKIQSLWISNVARSYGTHVSLNSRFHSNLRHSLIVFDTKLMRD